MIRPKRRKPTEKEPENKYEWVWPTIKFFGWIFVFCLVVWFVLVRIPEMQMNWDEANTDRLVTEKVEIVVNVTHDAGAFLTPGHTTIYFRDNEVWKIPLQHGSIEIGDIYGIVYKYHYYENVFQYSTFYQLQHFVEQKYGLDRVFDEVA